MFISTASLYIQIIPYCRQMINVAADSREKEISPLKPKFAGKIKLGGYFIKMDIWKQFNKNWLRKCTG
jgi:hypothetical protein